MEDSSSSLLAGMGWGTKRWVGYLRVTHRGEGDGGGCERRDDGAFHVGDARVVGVGGGAHDATRSRGGSAALAPERLRGAREGEQVSGDDGGHLLAMCRARWGDFGSEESVGACAAHGRGDARGTVTRGARRDASSPAEMRSSSQPTLGEDDDSSCVWCQPVREDPVACNRSREVEIAVEIAKDFDWMGRATVASRE